MQEWEIVWVAKTKRAAVHYAHVGLRKFTLLYEDNIATGRGKWLLIGLPTGPVEFTIMGRADVRHAQIAAEDKIQAFLRKEAAA